MGWLPPRLEDRSRAIIATGFQDPADRPTASHWPDPLAELESLPDTASDYRESAILCLETSRAIDAFVMRNTNSRLAWIGRRRPRAITRSDHKKNILTICFPFAFCCKCRIFRSRVPFEFNLAKSQANKAKHGIDFEEAQEIWNDENAIEGKTPHSQEERFYRIGRIGRQGWTAIFTYREGNIRIISVRRARKSEQAAYEH